MVSEFQHAYRKGHSTCTALTQLTDSYLSHMDKQELTGTVLLDFTAAFDLIDHELLFKKLAEYGFKSPAVDWIENYLSNRQQCVSFNGSLSNVKNLKCGLPQGSCLGPLLYAIFGNDLPKVLEKASVAMYADDTIIYGGNLNELNIVLQEELATVSNWVEKNRLKLNTSKTKAIVVASIYALRANPTLTISLQGVNIEQVKEAKLLGVWLDDTLSWTTHIHKLTTKMSCGNSVIRKSRFFLTGTTLKQVIHALVLAHLEYCPLLWSSASKHNLNKIQLTQNRAARLALNCSIREHVDVMHSRLSWLTVEQRVASKLAQFLKNLSLTKEPACLYNQLTLAKE